MELNLTQVPGSFRDPSGQVFQEKGRIYRTITDVYAPQWERAKDFLQEMVAAGLVLPYEEVEAPAGVWKMMKVEKLPFISYPYEWSHEQLLDAALLTLKLQKKALAKGLILKDASAYNIQFKGKKPIFMDHLSFEIWEEGTPWIAYGQFCSHFLAPLALIANVDLRLGMLSRLWIDGVPLDLAAAMMPKSKRLSPGLNFHLFVHAKMQIKHAQTDEDANPVGRNDKITKDYLIGLAESLERLLTSKAISLSTQTTEWGDYYDNTNYSEESLDHKYQLVAAQAKAYGGGSLALDLGANNGYFTRTLSESFDNCLAVDMDPLAVNQNYLALKKSKGFGNILPLIIDLGNPSPSLGFNNTERDSFSDRCQADMITALALIHHLRITAGIPLKLIAHYFATLLKTGGVLLLEFVPKDDSQTIKLLKNREDIFADYNLNDCQRIFCKDFELLSTEAIKNTKRHLLVLRKR